MTTNKHSAGLGDAPGDPRLVDAALGNAGDTPAAGTSTSQKAPEPPPAPDEAPIGDAPADGLDTSPIDAIGSGDDGAPAADAPALQSDEGVPFDYVGDAPEHIVNLSDDPIEGRRRELHVGGKTYSHVGEYLGKSWLYRHDA